MKGHVKYQIKDKIKRFGSTITLLTIDEETVDDWGIATPSESTEEDILAIVGDNLMISQIESVGRLRGGDLQALVSHEHSISYLQQVRYNGELYAITEIQPVILENEEVATIIKIVNKEDYEQ